MQHGDDVLADSDVSSIQVLGSVGEPINPQAWLWYRRIFSSGDVPVVDTWFQTETGGHMITPFARGGRYEARFSHLAIFWCPTRLSR